MNDKKNDLCLKPHIGCHLLRRRRRRRRLRRRLLRILLLRLRRLRLLLLRLLLHFLRSRVRDRLLFTPSRKLFPPSKIFCVSL